MESSLAGHFMHPRELELDGSLKDEHGNTVDVHCRLSFPVASHERVGVELSIPHTAMPTPSLTNACTFEGATQGPPGPITVRMRGLYWQQYTQTRANLTEFGRSTIKLQHIEWLDVSRSRNIDHIQKDEVVTIHMTTPKLTQEMRQLGWGKLADAHPIFSIRTGLGIFTFYRYWNPIFDHQNDTFSGVAGTFATLSSDEPPTELEGITNQINRVRLCLSLLSRQSVQFRSIHGCVDGMSIFSRRYPLDDKNPPHMGMEPLDYAVRISNVESVMEQAVGAALQMAEEDWNTLSFFITALAPAINMSTADRFMALMHGFEAIRVETTPLDETEAQEKSELIAALENAINNASTRVAERLKGFKKSVNNDKPRNFKARMRQHFKTSSVLIADLWPMVGASGATGLIDIRDRLAHMGWRSIDSQSLSVATWHLSLHAERYCFDRLGVPLSKTTICPEQLRREEWYSRATWQKARSKALARN